MVKNPAFYVLTGNIWPSGRDYGRRIQQKPDFLGLAAAGNLSRAMTYDTWLRHLLADADAQGIPVRLDAHTLHLLWEMGIEPSLDAITYQLVA